MRGIPHEPCGSSIRDGKAESVRKPPYLRLVKNNLVC